MRVHGPEGLDAVEGREWDGGFFVGGVFGCWRAVPDYPSGFEGVFFEGLGGGGSAA